MDDSNRESGQPCTVSGKAVRTADFPVWQLSLRDVMGDSSGKPATSYNLVMANETLQVESPAGASPEARVLKLSGSLTLSCCYDLQPRLRADASACGITDMTDIKYVASA